MVWRGDADIEDICQMFMDVLTSPSGVAALDIKAKTPPQKEKINIPSKMMKLDVEADDAAEQMRAMDPNANADLPDEIEPIQEADMEDDVDAKAK